MDQGLTFNEFFQKLVHSVRDGQGLILEGMIFRPKFRDAISKFSSGLSESDKEVFLCILLAVMETTIYNTMQFVEEPFNECELYVKPDSRDDKVPILQHLDNLQYEASVAVSRFAQLRSNSTTILEEYATRDSA